MAQKVKNVKESSRLPKINFSLFCSLVIIIKDNKSDKRNSVERERQNMEGEAWGGRQWLINSVSSCLTHLSYLLNILRMHRLPAWPFFFTCTCIFFQDGLAN